MSAASDRLAALTSASFENGLHRTALPAAFNDVATVGDEVAGTAYDLVAAVAAQDAAAASAVAASASASAAAATIPATLDRTVGRRANDTAIWSMVRSTPAWGFGPTGDLEETAIDTLRWEFNPATLAPFGAAFAGANTNLVRNTRLEGSPPTNTTIAPGGGLTVTYISSGTEGAMPYATYEVTGTPISSASSNISFEASGIITAASGDVLSAGFHAALDPGFANIMTGATFTVSLASVGGTTHGSDVFFVPTVAALRGQRHVTLRTMPASTTSAIPRLRISGTVGVAVSFRIRVALPMVVARPFLPSPILPPVGTPGSSTRAQGTVSIPVRDLGSKYNYRQGVVIVDWNSQPGAFTSAADTDYFGIVSLGDLGANEVMGLVTNAAHTAALFRRTVGGVVQSSATLTITAPAAGETVRFAAAWDIDAGLMQVAARGAVGAQLTGQTSIPIITHLMPGRFSTTRPLYGRINGLEIRPAAVWGSTLAALT